MKGALFYLTVIVFAPLVGNCQEHNSKWIIGLNASLDYYVYNLSNDDGTGISNFEYKRRLNYSVGVSTYFQASKRFSIGLDALYSEKGLIKSRECPSPPGEPCMEKLNYFFGFIDIPVSLRYHFISRDKFSMYVSCGLNTSVLISLKENGIYQTGQKRSFDGSDIPVEKMLFGIKAGFGAEKMLNKNIGLFLNPYFNYSINKLNNLLLLSNPLSFGMGFGILYHM